ncbi:MAG: hypothetical protein K9K79_01595 [Desulfohalobiaceae bacterium]|nr:hypothetical protein [Desulfohalobiaceae bacterium]
MTDEHSEYSVKLAWQTALEIRGCPPDRILFSGERSNDMKQKHLQSCPFCRERLEHEDLFAEVDKIGISREREKTDAEQDIGPGQIRLVDPDLGGWGPRNRYYNPPHVLVLKLLSGPGAAVEVAQIHTDELLSGPGDVDLGQGQGYAQAWNTYTLAAKDLDNLQGLVSEDLTKQILALSGQEPEPVDQYTVLFYFRQLELAVGSFVASRSINRLLADHEADKQESSVKAIQDLDPESLRRQLTAQQPELILPENVSSALELIGLASFQDQALAASDTAQAVEAKWLSLKQQGPEIQPARIALTLMERTQTECILAGRLLPEGTQADCLYAWWQAENSIRPAEESRLSPNGQYFHVQFSGLPEPQSNKEKISLLFCPHE